ncbi:MAG TPA: hypothetical protein VNF91_09635 [Candidatus Acidoferrum sp.]|nr:hypothetical protein [Candidatus Acidoferrum sp.]
MRRERIYVNEHLDERDIVTREPAPSTELVFAGTGPGRGAWEESQAANDVVEVEYIRPGARAA